MSKLSITAIILAGGKSRRMQGKDKGLQLLHNKPLYLHVIDRIKSQVDNIIINSNLHIEKYQQSNYPVICDKLPGFLGPLAGIYTGLINSQTDWVLFVSCDTPFLPANLVECLWQGIKINNSDLAYASDGERDHPTILLINKSQAKKIKDYLENKNNKLLILLNNLKYTKIHFYNEKQAFININTLEELEYWNNIK